MHEDCHLRSIEPFLFTAVLTLTRRHGTMENEDGSRGTSYLLLQAQSELLKQNTKYLVAVYQFQKTLEKLRKNFPEL